MKKRLLCFVMSAFLILVCFPAQGLAVEENNTDDVEVIDSGNYGLDTEWYVDADNVLVISGSGPMDSFEEGAAPWFQYRESIEKVIVNEDITSVGSNSFAGYSNITAVELAQSVQLIEDYAFANCSHLASVTFKGSAPSFGENECCFENTEATIYYPENIGYWDESVMKDYGGTLSWTSYCLHTYEEEIYPATCTENGYTKYTCIYCDDSYVDNEVEAFGHQYDDGVVTSPTCTEEGYTTYTCDICGESYTDHEVEATGHQNGDGIVTPPTCTEKGFTTYTCEVCGESYTDHEVQASGHQYDQGVVTPPTCTNKGYTLYTCTICGDTYTDNEVEAIGHQYDEGVVTLSTCTEKGYTTYKCTVCGHSYRDHEVDATGHKYGKSVVTPPTCTEIGFSTYTCTVCGEQHVDDVVPATGHSFSHVSNIDGTHTSTCSVCSYKETVPCADNNGDAVCDDCGERIILGYGECGNQLTWFLYGDGILAINGSGTMTDYASAAEVPWTDLSSSIKSIIFPDGLQSVGNYAFYNCTSLETIAIPNSVESIGDYSFSGCTGANGELVLPSELKQIGDYAFQYCNGLSGDLTIPEKTTEIGASSFMGCRGMNGILTLPEGLEMIPSYAFADCGFSGQLTIPNSVNYIDGFAFDFCHSLTDLVFGEGLGRLSFYSFHGCYGIQTITFRSSEPPVIGEDETAAPQSSNYASMFFGSLYELQTILVPKGTFTKYAEAYGIVLNSNVRIREATDSEFIINDGTLVAYMGESEEVSIPDEVMVVGPYAFLNHGEVVRVTLPEHIISIRMAAFKGCQQLESINVTDMVDEIGAYAFYGCESLGAIAIGNKVARIEDYCFYGCTMLEEVSIQEQTRSIGDYAFQNCFQLKNIPLTYVTEIRSYAFCNCYNLESVHITPTLTTLGDYAFGYSTINELYVDINQDTINSNALIGTTVKTVQFGKDVTTITGSYITFSGLEEIVVDEENNTYASQEGVLFDKAMTILQRYPSRKSDEEFVIPDSVQAIANNAFSSCTLLKAITIPINTTSIGTNAFSGCTGLTKVYYKGDKLQWRLININTGNQYLIGATIYFNDQREVGEQQSGWDGSISTEFGGGKGTSTEPYLITNAEELALLAKNVNAGTVYSGKYFRMTNDIIMNATDDWKNWTESYAPRNAWKAAIGTSSYPFQGYFDGDNYSIYGLYTKQRGLFGVVKSCTIKNLNIRESFIYSTSSGVGGIAASSSYGTIENCINQATVRGNEYVGGIVGSNGRTQIKNCHNVGKILGSESVGGIVGKCIGSIDNCMNEGEVIGTTSVGGIIGYLDAVGASSNTSSCVNNGEVSGGTDVGGIIGYTQQGLDPNVTIEKCENHGTVRGTSSNIGGVLGRSYARGYSRTFIVQTSANYGNVQGGSFVGGIVGYGYNYFTDTRIANCYNIGRISGTSDIGGIYGGGDTRSGFNDGGWNNADIKCTYNIGDVSGNNRVGGIASTTTRVNCSNSYFLETCGGGSGPGKSLSAAQMLLQSSYPGFDFSAVWQMDNNFGRPVLRGLSLPTTLDTNIHLGSWDSSIDDYIIEEVGKYTSSGKYEQYDHIMSADTNEDEKLRRLNELFVNYGFTDVREGIKYLSNTTSNRYAYLYLTTNESFCAFNYWAWLNTTTKGKFARGLLYADGLIFNNEVYSYLDPATYVESEYPGVKKNKTLLKKIIESGNDSTVSDILSTSNKTAKYLKNILKINGLVSDAEMDSLMDQIMNCKSEEKLERLQKQYAEKIVHQLQLNDTTTIHLGGEEFSKALGYSARTLSIAQATVDDINDFVNLDRSIAQYQRYKRFLMTIYTNEDVSWEMRAAAYSLLDDINNGYWNRLIHVLDEVISYEKDYFESGLVYDKSLMQAAAERVGVGSFAELLGEATGTIKLATFVSNIIIDTGDFVKQVAYTQGYAELAALYSFKLADDKTAFLADSSAENAWTFFEDYTMLWNLRYQGEQQYLDMNSVKMFLFAKVNNYGYAEKEAVVNDNLKNLKNCKFEVPDTYTIPASVQYMKKAVVNCPVDIYVYTDSGELVASLIDGIESDVTNGYGRFAVVHQSYTGEYAKVICQSTSEHLNYEMRAVSGGLVDYESCDGGDIEAFDKVEVEEGNLISVNSDSLEIDKDADGVSDETIDLKIKSEEDYYKVTAIETNVEELVFDSGEAKTVNVTILPDNATNTTLTWVSMDESIATVKNGVVTPVAAGETTIRVIAADGDEIELEIPVTVLESAITNTDDGRASLYGASLRLTGDIGVNFYYEFTDTMLQDEDARISIQVGDQEVQKFTINEAVVDTTSVADKTLYKFTCFVSAKQMYDPIVVQAEGTEYLENPHTYSVRKYADNILSKDKYSDELKYLVRVMMHYGACSQEYLSYHTEKPASLGMDMSDIVEAAENLTVDDLDAYVSQKTDMPEGITLYGANLSLKSETVLRYHFIVDEDHDISEYTFTVNGLPYTTVEINGRQCVEINNIRAQDLDEMFTVTVSDQEGNEGSVTYGAMTYVRNIIKNGTDKYSQALIDTARSLYLYNKAAEVYLASKE